MANSRCSESANRRWADPEARRLHGEAMRARWTNRLNKPRAPKISHIPSDLNHEPLPFGDYESVLPLRELDVGTLTARARALALARHLAFPDPRALRDGKPRSLEIWNRVTAMIGATLEAIGAKS